MLTLRRSATLIQLWWNYNKFELGSLIIRISLSYLIVTGSLPDWCPNCELVEERAYIRGPSCPPEPYPILIPIRVCGRRTTSYLTLLILHRAVFFISSPRRRPPAQLCIWDFVVLIVDQFLFDRARLQFAAFFLLILFAL